MWVSLCRFIADPIIPDASRAMLFAHSEQRDFIRGAFVDHIRAPGCELAAPGQMKKVWNGAFNSLQPALPQSFFRKPRNGPQKPFGVWMTRVVKDLTNRRFFDDP